MPGTVPEMMPRTEVARLRRKADTLRLAGMAGLLSLVMAQGTAAAPPLSANDWLTGGPVPVPPVSSWRPGQPVPADAARSRDAGRRPPSPPAGWHGAPADGPVGVTRLDSADPDRAGTLSAAGSGLPGDLWQGATVEQATQAITASQPRLPATDRLLRRLLLAQTAPPTRSEGEIGALFFARVDRLMALGAPDLAARLLDSAGPGVAGWNARRFDAALLLGQDDGGCELLTAAPGTGPQIAARVWCLARSGDWQGAAVTLQAARSLHEIDPGQAERLSAFLDDSQVDSGTPVPIPQQTTPLDFRVMAAIGAPLPTANLPVGFAWTDLGANGGWKARVEAAERLARAGSLSGSRLRAIYLEDAPAASGGVWDRVSAIQALDTAQRAGDGAAVASALPRAVAAMARAGLTAPLSEMFATDLARMALPDKAGRLALTLALYSSDLLPPQAYEGLAEPGDPDLARNLAIARGEPMPDEGEAADSFEAIITKALTDPPPAPTEGAEAETDGGAGKGAAGPAAGLAILAAMEDVDAGLDGDAARAARGIATLRAFGLEQAARGAVLQLLVGPKLGVRT